MNFSPSVATAIALTASCFGATTVTVTKQDVTATQAIVRVRTDQTGFCTYRVSEGAGFNAPVNDVNASLFSGSDSDSRPGSIVRQIESNRFSQFTGGSDHVFVAGTRTSGVAADGKRYSRALQANTLHWVGVACGTDAEVSTTFVTLNPPLGQNGPESPVFDSGAFGNVGVPTMNWADRTATYIDPATGLQLRRMTDPSDVGFYSANLAFNYALNPSGHWTSPTNALSAGSASLATCDTSASCTSSDALVLIGVIPTSATNFGSNGGWDPRTSYLDFLVKAWGSGTDSSAANRTVSACWTVDSQTCFTSAQSIVLPQSGAAFAGTAPQTWGVQAPWNSTGATKLTNIVVSSGTATVNFQSAHGLSAGGQICVNGIRNAVTTAQGGNGLNGCHTIASATSTSLTFASNAFPATYTDGELLVSPGFPQAQWASWGTAPTHQKVGQKSGNVTATAGAAVLNSGNSFDPEWAAGTKIFIAGSSPTCASNLCTISAMTDSKNLTLVENLTLSNAAYTNANFGILLKKATDTGSVSISASYDFVFSANFDSGLDGSGDICNSNYVTVSVDAAGNPMSPVQGFLCQANASPISQAAKPIYLFIPATGETRLIARDFQPSVNDYRAWVGWHPSSGNCWFTSFSLQSVFRACYGGDYRSLTPGFPQATSEAGTPEQLTFTDIFGGAGNDMTSQLSSCAANGKCDSPGINSAMFPLTPAPPQTGAAIKGSYMVMCAVVKGGSQDGPGYISMWDISAVPAVLQWATYTFDRYPVGYAGVHACINFGNGQFNADFLNGSGGQVGGTMKGPWQATPAMYDKGSGYTSNTSVLLTYGFECPAGLDPRWQALGARPLAQGGVARCLRFKIPGDFCSVHATAAEAAAFPCPWSAAPDHSLIKPIGEGDELSDLSYGFVSYGEKMLVVKVDRNSNTDIDLTVFRFGSNAQTPDNGGFTCGTYGASEWNHANGWTMIAMPFRGCPGGTYWLNALDATHSYIAETPTVGGNHPDFGEGSSGYTYVGGAPPSYLIRPNQPLPSGLGTPVTVSVLGSPVFSSGQIPDIYLQSYPSKRQQGALTPGSEMNWALDVRHYNPSSGQSAESPESLFGNTVTLVAGTRQTYRITFAGNQTPDPKLTGFVGWSGYHMLGDASGPSSASTFGDSTPWRYCYVFSSGECVSGSTAGQIYVSIPQAQSANQCLTNTYSYNATCLSNNYPYGFWVTQFDTTATDKLGVKMRRLTSSLVAPGRQYNFTNAKSTPDGRWVLVMAPWLEGQRSEMLWVKLPPFPDSASNAGISAGATRVGLALSGATGDALRVAFGYAENGDAANFYCTSRAEACYTSAAATVQAPFVYASETQSPSSCTRSCSVSIPALPGRIVYYQLERKTGSQTVTTGMGAIAVQ
ncbi:MAG: hypothetical protein LAO79_14260 [Acidobacteriia bacterium]|nr:hypothetical protein [Terriglobia bacterium]